MIMRVLRFFGQRLCLLLFLVIIFPIKSLASAEFDKVFVEPFLRAIFSSAGALESRSNFNQLQMLKRAHLQDDIKFTFELETVDKCEKILNIDQSMILSRDNILNTKTYEEHKLTEMMRISQEYGANTILVLDLSNWNINKGYAGVAYSCVI